MHIASAAKSRFELLQDKESVSVIPARFMIRLDVNGPNLAAVLSVCQIGACAIVSSIKSS
jgi:hypothetical protein